MYVRTYMRFYFATRGIKLEQDAQSRFTMSCRMPKKRPKPIQYKDGYRQASSRAKS